MAEVISDGIINSLILTNSAEANLEFTRTHERLLTRTFISYPFLNFFLNQFVISYPLQTQEAQL